MFSPFKTTANQAAKANWVTKIRTSANLLGKHIIENYNEQSKSIYLIF